MKTTWINVGKPFGKGAFDLSYWAHFPMPGPFARVQEKVNELADVMEESGSWSDEAGHLLEVLMDTII